MLIAGGQSTLASASQPRPHVTADERLQRPARTATAPAHRPPALHPLTPPGNRDPCSPPPARLVGSTSCFFTSTEERPRPCLLPPSRTRSLSRRHYLPLRFWWPFSHRCAQPWLRDSKGQPNAPAEFRGQSVKNQNPGSTLDLPNQNLWFRGPEVKFSAQFLKTPMFGT